MYAYRHTLNFVCHALGWLRRLYDDSLFGVEVNIRLVVHMQGVSIVLNIVGYWLVRFKLYRLWIRLVRVFLFLHGLYKAYEKNCCISVHTVEDDL